MPTDPTVSREDSREALALIAAAGETVPVAGNRPVLLDDPGVAWLVADGILDVFVAEHVGGHVASALKHVVRLGAGRMVFGARGEGPGASLRLLAKGTEGTRLRRVPIPGLLARADVDAAARALADAVDAWIEDFSAAITREITPRPLAEHRLPPVGRVSAHGVLMAERGVVWVSGAAAAAFLGTEPVGPGGSGPVPVTTHAWLDAAAPAELDCAASANLGPEALLLKALPEFHRLCFGAESLNQQLLLADEANLQVAAAGHRDHQKSMAERSLLRLDEELRTSPEGSRFLLDALRAIGRHEGIAFRSPGEGSGQEPSFTDILKASRVRARRVRLAKEDRWWLGDSGAMLAFRRDDGRPVALLPSAAGGYRILDPATGEAPRVRAENVGELHEYAWFPYRPLRRDEAVDMRTFFDVARRHLGADLARLAAAGAAAGLLMLAPAVAVGVLIGAIAPFGDEASLLRFTGALALLAVAAGLMHMFRGTALMRLEGRISARLTAAVWDRLLKLPTGFFRRFAAGDVAERAVAFMVLRDRTAGVAADALLSMLFALPAIGVLFFYDAALGWLNLAMGGGVLAVTALFGVAQLGPQRRYFRAARCLAGDLHQLITGIGKLRAAQAEEVALTFWARQYREKKQAEIRTAAYNERLTSLCLAVPALASALVFAVALTREELELADFLTVYAVSMVLYSSLTALGLSFQAIATIVPGCEQVLAILSTETEDASGGREPITLGGELRFERVNFRYSEDGPKVLHDVSIHANPGEFVAVVGESGAGKSTLIQLALGLERPETGSVSYDGRDLAHLDTASVRRQVGVVVQDGALLIGDVRNNIIGEAPDLSIDDAWRAARLARVADDIAAMPMGMHTPAGESATTFSGGQIQRIRIAAALVHNPRIVFLDEATSWLDVRAQAETISGIEKLAATRIVIAHRLSTVRKADRIYVMQGGRVVQTGGFEELLAAPGPFQDLARRQVV